MEPRDAVLFPKLLLLGCGQNAAASTFPELVDIGRVADYYGMEAVSWAVQWAAIQHLTVTRAAELLASTEAAGLEQVREASRELALTRFEEFAASEGFIRLDEVELDGLLADERLNVAGEELVLEATARWMLGGQAQPGIRGERLLRRIRFGAVGAEYLEGRALELLPESAALKRLVAEALSNSAREAPHIVGDGQRVARGVVRLAWHRYEAGCARREMAQVGTLGAVAVCGAHVCWGGYGKILVAPRAGGALKAERELDVRKIPRAQSLLTFSCNVHSLACWRGMLVSGVGSQGLVMVWDPATGRFLGTIDGHTRHVVALAVSGAADGERLLTGSRDCSFKVWVVDADARPWNWRCERTVECRHDVRFLAALDGKAVAGTFRSVSIWDVSTGAEQQTIALDSVAPPYSGLRFWGFDAMTACRDPAGGGRLLVFAFDGKLAVLSLDTGALLRSVDAYPREARMGIGALAVHGDKLISGTADLSPRCEVCVWDLGTLALEHVLKQPGCAGVGALLSDGHCVRVAVDRWMVVWGWEDGARAGSPETRAAARAGPPGGREDGAERGSESPPSQWARCRARPASARLYSRRQGAAAASEPGAAAGTAAGIRRALIQLSCFKRTWS